MATLFNIIFWYYFIGATLIFFAFTSAEIRILKIIKGKSKPTKQEIEVFTRYAIFKVQYRKSSIWTKAKYWCLALTFWIFIAIWAWFLKKGNQG